MTLDDSTADPDDGENERAMTAGVPIDSSPPTSPPPASLEPVSPPPASPATSRSALPPRTIVIGDLDGLTATDDDGSRAERLRSDVIDQRASLRASGPMVFGGAQDEQGGVSTVDAAAADRVATGDDLVPATRAGTVDHEDDGGPRVIVIGDADDIDPDAPIDPRIRKRRRAVKRAAGLRRLRWILITIAVVAVLVGTSLVLRSSVFAVRSVVVTGVHYTDSDSVDAITGPLHGRSMVDVNLVDIRRKLEAMPWVKAVDVTRDWPSTIRIEILERRPVAFYGGADQLWHVLDENGRVVTTMSGKPIDYLELSGSTEAIPAGEAGPPELLAGAQVANAIPDALKGQIEMILVAKGEVTLRLRRPGDDPSSPPTTPAPKGGKAPKATTAPTQSMIELGTVDDLKAKLVTVLSMSQTCPPGSYQTMDVRVANRPAVTPKNGCKNPTKT